jgi:hypothetical protein
MRRAKSVEKFSRVQDWELARCGRLYMQPKTSDKLQLTSVLHADCIPSAPFFSVAPVSQVAAMVYGLAGALASDRSETAYIEVPLIVCQSAPLAALTMLLHT